jgi:protocatechuate 3,4-dioxygenase beta subunit
LLGTVSLSFPISARAEAGADDPPSTLNLTKLLTNVVASLIGASDRGSQPTLNLTLRLPDGQPATNIPVQTVGMRGGRPTERRTDAAGKLSFPLQLNDTRMTEGSLCLLARDVTRNLALAVDLDEESTNLDLKLAPAVTLAIRAECEGKPLPGATAELIFWAGQSGMHLEGFATATNTPGHFEIPALPPGRRYGLSVHAPGHGRKYVDATAAANDPGRVDMDAVELRPANLKLAGQVLDSNDKPVAQAYVHLSGNDQPPDSARTDRDGRFTFDAVCEGAVQIFANSNAAHGNASAEGGDTNVVLHLGENTSVQPGATRRKLAGHVLGTDNQPAAGVAVAVLPSDSLQWVKSGTNGQFNIAWTVQPWQSQAESLLLARDPARNLAAAEEIPDEATNLTVRLKPAFAVAGRVEGPQGVALAKAEVGLWLLGGNAWTSIDEKAASTDAQGEFDLKCLPEGPRYMIFASAPGHGRHQEELELDTATNHLRLDPFVLPVADKVLAGQVINLKDKPVVGATVSLSGEDQPQGSATTDRQGRFQFKVCEGTVSLFAYNSGMGDSYGNTSAEAGDTNVVIQLGGNSNPSRPASKRVSLSGKPLPDLAPAGLDAAVVPAGKAVLLCLLDIEQRPSRRLARLLAERHDALRQKGIAVVAIYAGSQTQALADWQTASPVPFPVGRIAEPTPATQWVRAAESLPWLILADPAHRVSAEGFTFEELDDRIAALGRTATPTAP